MKFRLAISDNDTSQNRRSPIIDYILTDPLNIGYDEMWFPDTEKEDFTRLPFDPKEWKNHALNREQTIANIINFKDEKHFSLMFSIDKKRILVSLEINTSDHSINLMEIFRSFNQLMPSLIIGYCAMDGAYKLYDELKLPWTQNCFNLSLGWSHLMSKSEYEEYYTKEVLLNAPAFKVEEREDESIFFQCYENPFEFEKEVEQVKVISKYLNENENELEQL